MVVMLRSVGVPARFVVGYTPGQLKPHERAERRGDQYRILERNAHAWPEVYFPSYGWVQFEPTASEPLLARPADPADNLDAGLVPDVGPLNPEMEPALPEPQPLDVATPVAAPSAFETWLRGNWGWLAAIAALTAAAVGAWRYLRWRQIDLFRDTRGAFAAVRAARPVGNAAADSVAVEPDAAGTGRGVQRPPARGRACRRYDCESVHRSAVRAPAAAGREHHRPRPQRGNNCNRGCGSGGWWARSASRTLNNKGEASAAMSRPPASGKAFIYHRSLARAAVECLALISSALRVPSSPRRSPSGPAPFLTTGTSRTPRSLPPSAPAACTWRQARSTPRPGPAGPPLPG